MIKVIEIIANNGVELEQKLNEEVSGRLISVKHRYDNLYEVIYQED